MSNTHVTGACWCGFTHQPEDLTPPRSGGFDPTPEQAKALDLFATGEDLVIEAGAGTGKTATLVLLAESTPRTGAYLAFNRAIVAEAGSKMPGSVTCTTAHGLAMRAVGHEYRHRLDAKRMKAAEAARIMGINAIEVTTEFGRKRLAPGFLAGVVNRTIDRFCQSADDAPGEQHVPYLDGIDLPTPDGRRGWANNREVRLHLAPAIARAWADLSTTTGHLRFNHGHYLKLWHLAGPRIGADFILFDEAQDANPVMLAIVTAQDHAQRVYVGDSQQEIYGFTGAINALAAIETPHRTFLTQSFRFGPQVAATANTVLARLGAELMLRGTPTIASVVGPVAEPDVILTRTNAKSVELALDAIEDERKPFIVGGATEVVAFARGAKSLQEEGWTSHPELACFSSWGEVIEYVDQDQQGDELRLLVNLIEKFGADVIIDALGSMGTEARADVVISTAHKSKGREWDRVKLAADFPNGLDPKSGEPKDPSPEELRLIYVAITRARRELDLGASVGRLIGTFAADLVAAIDKMDGPAPVATVDSDLGVPASPWAKDLTAGLGPVVDPDHVLATTLAAGPVSAELVEYQRVDPFITTLRKVAAGVAGPGEDPLGDLLAAGAELAGEELATAARLALGCPSCGRTDVVRSTGLIGAHTCTGVRRR